MPRGRRNDESSTSSPRPTVRARPRRASRAYLGHRRGWPGAARVQRRRHARRRGAEPGRRPHGVYDGGRALARRRRGGECRGRGCLPVPATRLSPTEFSATAGGHQRRAERAASIIPFTATVPFSGRPGPAPRTGWRRAGLASTPRRHRQPGRSPDGRRISRSRRSATSGSAARRNAGAGDRRRGVRGHLVRRRRACACASRATGAATWISGHHRRLQVRAHARRGAVSGPAWSPDGAQIAYYRLTVYYGLSWPRRLQRERRRGRRRT